jgi:hypothetical protein
MDVQRLVCVSCGAPIQVSADSDRLQCAYCGVMLTVDRSAGHAALKTAQQVRQTIQDVGAQTQTSIREGAQVTQAELQRLQISNELSSVQLQLSSVQSEIRTLERQPASSTVRRQLLELRRREADLLLRAESLQASLATTSTGGGRAPFAPAFETTGRVSTKEWLVTFLLCAFLGIFGAHRFYTGHMVVGVIQLVSLGGLYVWWLIDLVMIAFNKFTDSNGLPLRNPNPLVGKAAVAALAVFLGIGIVLVGVSPDLAVMAGILAAVAVFCFIAFPNAGIWQTLGLRKKT